MVQVALTDAEKKTLDDCLVELAKAEYGAAEYMRGLKYGMAAAVLCGLAGIILGVVLAK